MYLIYNSVSCDCDCNNFHTLIIFPLIKVSRAPPHVEWIQVEDKKACELHSAAAGSDAAKSLLSSDLGLFLRSKSPWQGDRAFALVAPHKQWTSHHLYIGSAKFFAINNEIKSPFSGPCWAHCLIITQKRSSGFLVTGDVRMVFCVCKALSWGWH